MARVARLFHFAANTLLLVIAIATGLFTYAAFMGTGPFVHTDLFPTSILTGKVPPPNPPTPHPPQKNPKPTVLAKPTKLRHATTQQGCCGGYRQSPRFLLIYLLSLLACAGIRISAATLSHKASKPSTAAASIASLYASSTDAQKKDLLSMFNCCGWTSADALAVEAQMSDTSQNACSGPCAERVTQSRIETMTAVAWVMWVAVTFECAGIVCAAAMMLGIRQKRKVEVVTEGRLIPEREGRRRSGNFVGPDKVEIQMNKVEIERSDKEGGDKNWRMENM
ncbi:hypothetical protein HDV00_001624 [Rhizophlyctis rosea]|nr:hypothetical protein HDV00_001624 [Rhizophlyctis rosea]